MKIQLENSANDNREPAIMVRKSPQYSINDNQILLSWEDKTGRKIISSSDTDRIWRQMISLRNRGIPAIAQKGNRTIGYVEQEHGYFIACLQEDFDKGLYYGNN